jgi:hypothetical protein
MRENFEEWLRKGNCLGYMPKIKMDKKLENFSRGCILSMHAQNDEYIKFNFVLLLLPLHAEDSFD